MIGGGGLGDLMEGNTGMTDLEQEMMGIDGEDGIEQASFQKKVFINMDEDDEGGKGINLSSLFKLEGGALPYNIDVSNFNSSF